MAHYKRRRVYFDVGHVRGFHGDDFSKNNPPPEQRPELATIYKQLIAIVDTDRYITAIDVSHQEDWARLVKEFNEGRWFSISLRLCDGFYRGGEQEIRRYKPGKEKYTPNVK